MAKKVNTKFLAGLTAAVVLAGGGLVALVQFSKKTPEQHIAIAETLLAQGEDHSALAEFGKAVHKDPRNVPAAEAMLALIETSPVSKTTAARSRLTQRNALLRNLADAHRENPAYRRKYFDFLANALDAQAGGFMGLYEAANARVTSNPDDTTARRYRAVAVAQAPGRHASQATRRETTEDFQIVLAADPDDALALYGHALWQLEDIQTQREAGIPLAALQSKLDGVQATAERLIELDPVDARNQRWRVLLLSNLAPLRPDEQREAVLRDLEPAFRSLLEKAKAQAGEPNRLLDVLQTARIARRFFNTQAPVELNGQPVRAGAAASIRLLKHVLEASPHQPIAVYDLAETYAEAGLYDEAIAGYRDIIERAKQPAPAETYLRLQYFANNARYQAARLMLSEKTPESGLRAEDLSQAKTWADELIKDTGKPTPATHHLQALIAAADGQPEAALRHFDLALAIDPLLGGQAKFNILKDALAAASAGNANQGRLRRWLQEAVDISPRNLTYRLQLANMDLQAAIAQTPGRDYFGLASDHADFFKRLTDPPIAPLIGDWLWAQIHAAQNPTAAGYRQALDQIKPHPAAAIQAAFPNAPVVIANWHSRAGEPSASLDLLKTYLESRPTDFRAAALYLTQLPTAAQKQEALDRLQTLGVAGPALEQLNTLALGSPQDIQALVNQRLQERASQTSDINQQQRLARVAIANDRFEEAIEAAEKALKTDAENPAAWAAKLEATYSLNGTEPAAQVAQAAHAATGIPELAWRGYLAYLEGDLQRARVLLEKASQDAPASAFIETKLGGVFLASKDPVSATTHFTRAIDLSGMKRSREALLGLAAASQAMGNEPETTKAWRALAANNLYISNREWLSYADYEASLGNLDRAIRVREQVAAVSPETNQLRRRIATDYATLAAKTPPADQTRAHGLRVRANETLQAIIADEGHSSINAVAAARVAQILDGDAAGEQALHDYLADQAGEATYTDWLALGEYLIATDKPSEAVAAYQHAVALEPEDQRPASRRLATIYQSLGQMEQAVEIYQQVAAAVPDDPVVLARYIDLLVRLRRFDQAIEQASKMDPSTGATPITRAQQSMAQRDPFKAVQITDAALRQSDGLADQARATLLRTRASAQVALDPSPTGMQSAIRDLQSALTLNPADAASVLILADLYRQSNQAALAVELLTRHPSVTTSPQGKVVQIQAAAANREFLRANALAQDAAAADPENPVWHRLRGQLLAGLGDEQAAADAWLKAHAITQSIQDAVNAIQACAAAGRDPDLLAFVDQYPQAFTQSPELQTLRGLALYRTGRSDAALQVFRSALAKDLTPTVYQRISAQAASKGGLGADATVQLLDSSPAPSELWRAAVTALLYATSDPENLPAAAARVDAFWPIAADSNETSAAKLAASRTRGVIYQKLGRPTIAQKAYEAALMFDPSDPETLNNFAYLLTVDRSDPQSALPLIERAAGSAIGQQPAIQDTLGLVHLKLGNLERSRDVFERLTQNAPEMAIAHHHLGLVYAALDGDTHRLKAQLSQQTARSLAARANDTDTQQRAESELQRLQVASSP